MSVEMNYATDPPVRSQFRFTRGNAIFAGLMLLVILGIGGAGAIVRTHTIDYGNELQQQIVANYNLSQVVVNDCVRDAQNTAQGSDAKTSGLGLVLAQAVRGMFNNPGSSQQPGYALNSARFLQAVQEVHPHKELVDSTIVATMNVILACQSRHLFARDTAIGLAHQLSTWVNEDSYLHDFRVSFPTTDLAINTPEGIGLTGVDALQYLQSGRYSLNMLGAAWNARMVDGYTPLPNS